MIVCDTGRQERRFSPIFNTDGGWIMEQRIRVFIADASRDFPEMLADALAQEPDFLVVGCASRGDEAYARLASTRVDLLVADLLLPGLDGLSLLRRLKQEGALPHAVVVSGFFNDRMGAAVSAVADNYLPKPCRAEDLIARLRECVLGVGPAFVRDYSPAVTRALIDCGVLPHLDGFTYLRDGLLRALEDRSALRGVTKSLYRDIARQHGTTPVCVERSIRSAIERAWQCRSAEDRRRCFGGLFDPFPKAPSNVPFLTAMTEYIDSLYEKDAAL